MRDIALLVWLTQLGLSVAVPPVGFILLALWLQSQFQWGNWVLWVAVIVGVICAVDGLRSSLRTLEKLTRKKKKDKTFEVPSYNDHD